jgi:hypothetical protein
MKLPKEYKKYAVPGGYDKCTSTYGKKMLAKFGFGPEYGKVVETPTQTPAPAPKKKTTTRKKKSTK